MLLNFCVTHCYSQFELKVPSITSPGIVTRKHYSKQPDSNNPHFSLFCKMNVGTVCVDLYVESMFSWKWHENGTRARKLPESGTRLPKGTLLSQNSLWWCQIDSTGRDLALQWIWDLSAQCHRCDVTGVTKCDIFRTWSDLFNMGRICSALMPVVILQIFEVIGRREVG